MTIPNRRESEIAQPVLRSMVMMSRSQYARELAKYREEILQQLLDAFAPDHRHDNEELGTVKSLRWFVASYRTPDRKPRKLSP